MLLLPEEQVLSVSLTGCRFYGPHSFVDGPFGSEMKSSEYSGERGVRLVESQKHR